MPDLRWWALVAVLVAIAAFLTGLLRGATDTAPFEVDAGLPEVLSAVRVF